MNPYVIAPHLVRINLDKALSEQYSSLDKRLRWRPLTLNLDCCEEAPYIYFRIVLKRREPSTTYAGFSTGAPFMLMRDVEVKKRAFFLRHWVRQVEGGNSNAPTTIQKYMAIGANDNRLLLRVDIDRPFETKDTFKSVPFATTMFQIIQVDAIIHEMPHVRLAFAIERTITAEERETLLAQSKQVPNTDAKRGSTASTSRQIQPSSHPATLELPTASRIALPVTSVVRTSENLQRSAQPAPVQAPAMPQAVRYPRASNMANGQPIRQVPATSRSPSNMYHNPYHYISSRQVPMPMRPVAPPRLSSVHSQVPPVSRLISRTHNRPPLTSTPTTLAIPSVSPHYSGITENSKSNTHPDVRIWEEHDASNPYEPFFISEDPKFEEKVERSIVLDSSKDNVDRFNYNSLFGFPSRDFTFFSLNYPGTVLSGDEADIEFCVEKVKKRKMQSDAQSASFASAHNTDKNEEYSAVVIAAASYNTTMHEERRDLKQWLIDDAERQEQRLENEGENDGGDSLSE